jgi:hypothetical protein
MKIFTREGQFNWPNKTNGPKNPSGLSMLIKSSLSLVEISGWIVTLRLNDQGLR